MVDPDILARKTGQIVHHCDRLARRATLEPADLAGDEDLSNAVLMDLQQAVQACIDLAVHVCVDEAIGTPAHSAQAFDLLAREGVIPEALASRLTGAVGLRNLIVHQYADLEYERVIGAMRSGLDDLRRFALAMHAR